MTYELAQQVPLLKDKDGTYIGLGDVVYAEDGTAYDIIGLGREFVWGRKAGCDNDKRLRPEWLTHEQPETWEQLKLALALEVGVSIAEEFIERAKVLAGKEQA